VKGEVKKINDSMINWVARMKVEVKKNKTVFFSKDTMIN